MIIKFKDIEYIFFSDKDLKMIFKKFINNYIF